MVKDNIFLDENLIKKGQKIYIGNSELIVYVNKRNKYKMVEITTVAYATLIKGDFVTIMYYDNEPSHEVKLHVHILDNYTDRNYATTTDNVRQIGSVHRLHTWAVEDLKHNWHNYKMSFLKRSGLKISDV